MAQPIDDIEIAWSSLRGSADVSGWRSISISTVGQCSLRAGLRFPEKHESLLASFSSSAIAAAEKLPDGQGFVVSRLEPSDDGLTWLALTRSSHGSLELFSAMVADVVGAMKIGVDIDEKHLLQIFLGRIRAWQAFMRRGIQSLSPESEIGLVGELALLRAIIDAGISPATAVEWWVGPLHGVRDFELGTGSMEVKATLSVTGFPAQIGSLEQLEDSVRQPLFLAGARLRQTMTGQTLPELVAEMSDVAAGEAEAVRLFSERVIAAGYFDIHADRYIRRFKLAEIRIVEVKDDFSRLTPGNVPVGVTKATYEIDLDKAKGPSISVLDALKKLGAI